jgi:hypothetical protein
MGPDVAAGGNDETTNLRPADEASRRDQDQPTLEALGIGFVPFNPLGNGYLTVLQTTDLGSSNALAPTASLSSGLCVW